MCTWLEQPYTSSVVSVLINVTIDMSPTGDLLVTSIFAGKCLHELALEPSCVALAWH